MENNVDKKMIKAIISGIFWFVVVVTFFASLETVKAGTTRQVTRFGEVTDRRLDPGAHFIIPFVNGTITYNTKELTYETAEEVNQKSSGADYKDYPVDTTTQDGQGVRITYTLRFKVDPSKIQWIANNIGKERDLIEKVVKTDSRGWVRTIARDFSSNDLYSGNVRDFQEKIFNELSPRFEDKGMFLDEVVIREPRFDPEYEKVMESKQKALEQVNVEKYIAEQAKHKKEATITDAEAQARAQELNRQTLDAQVLEKSALDVQMRLADKWNGVLPVNMYAGAAIPFIDVGK